MSTKGRLRKLEKVGNVNRSNVVFRFFCPEGESCPSWNTCPQGRETAETEFDDTGKMVFWIGVCQHRKE